MEVLTAFDVCKAYGNRMVLDHMAFDLKKGEIHAILGRNGAGKTTFIKILSALLAKDSGAVRIGGYDIDRDPVRIRRLIGYVGQDTERSAYARLTARENLLFFGRLRGMKEDQIRTRITNMSTDLGFQDKLDTPFMHLSGGQKQTMVIMRALLHEPMIVYLDEPTKGLDPLVSAQVRNCLKDYARNKGKSILLTSHILSEVEDLSDRVSLMRHGARIQSGTVLELRKQAKASEFIDMPKSDLPAATQDRLSQLPQVAFVTEREDGAVLSYGVYQVWEGMEAILQVLREDDVRATFRHRSLALEDLFVMLLGEKEEDSLERARA
ncbi:ABC transporter ATP-binding protein [Xylanibacillus composti]|uniref:ABC transporter ATP-binding protein n=1 Tax=Xylanibacillus composti TaxID=1572762 RepID=A0A8J4H432_9BACL|nr:ABC transporter ATP-binding protein [Xylanibacillus composti]MDT9725368.1 ABC transporter ATP-binding protein [Xylanibacillus composti]GIQ69132.1 ABC transporter ATP-binding protein [Xylanibacillus composti]